MAKGSLLGLLAWALPMQAACTCLRCWPDAVVYFGYDVYQLLGQDSDTTRRLVKLFLDSAGDLASNGRRYLEREHMEREAGNLFIHLEKIIQTSGKDHERLMREAEQEKQNFVKKLDEASHAFMKEICSLSCAKSRYRPYEVAHCINCKLLKAPCNDAIVCAGTKVLTGLLVTFLISLGIAAVVWYRHYKKKAGGEAEDQETDDKESSESSENSEESEEAVPNSQAVNVSNLPASNFPSPPVANIPSPPPFEIPSPPPFEMTSPPPPPPPPPPPLPFDIPSPPPFNDAGY